METDPASAGSLVPSTQAVRQLTQQIDMEQYLLNRGHAKSKQMRRALYMQRELHRMLQPEMQADLADMKAYLARLLRSRSVVIQKLDDVNARIDAGHTSKGKQGELGIQGKLRGRLKELRKLIRRTRKDINQLRGHLKSIYTFNSFVKFLFSRPKNWTMEASGFPFELIERGRELPEVESRSEQ